MRLEGRKGAAARPPPYGQPSPHAAPTIPQGCRCTTVHTTSAPTSLRAWSQRLPPPTFGSLLEASALLSGGKGQLKPASPRAARYGATDITMLLRIPANGSTQHARQHLRNEPAANAPIRHDKAIAIPSRGVGRRARTCAGALSQAPRAAQPLHRQVTSSTGSAWRRSASPPPLLAVCALQANLAMPLLCCCLDAMLNGESASQAPPTRRQRLAKPSSQPGIPLLVAG